MNDRVENDLDDRIAPLSLKCLIDGEGGCQGGGEGDKVGKVGWEFGIEMRVIAEVLEEGFIGNKIV